MKKTNQQYSWIFALSALSGMCVGLSGCGEFDEFTPGFTTGVPSGQFPGASGKVSDNDTGTQSNPDSGFPDGTGTQSNPGSGFPDGTGTQSNPGSSFPGDAPTDAKRYAILDHWPNQDPRSPRMHGFVRFFVEESIGAVLARVSLSECKVGYYEVDIREASSCGSGPSDVMGRWDPTGFGMHVLPDGSSHHAGVLGDLGCKIMGYPEVLETTSPHWKLDASQFDPAGHTVVLRDPDTGRDVACGEIYANDTE